MSQCNFGPSDNFLQAHSSSSEAKCCLFWWVIVKTSSTDNHNIIKCCLETQSSSENHKDQKHYNKAFCEQWVKQLQLSFAWTCIQVLNIKAVHSKGMVYSGFFCRTVSNSKTNYELWWTWNASVCTLCRNRILSTPSYTTKWLENFLCVQTFTH